MKSKFLPAIPAEAVNKAVGSKNYQDLFDMISEPLLEELYRRQTFEFLDELSDGQALLVSYDYVQSHVMVGGFLQLIQNGYIALLPPMPEWLTKVGAEKMAKVLDDALKVYVLNYELLSKKTSVEEFAKLYNEMKEFEILDKQFMDLNDDTFMLILQYAVNNLSDFLTKIE
ncbi:MAG TPA: DUF4375 domain-containing protein [Flavipsychrobacter sp.]|nr:DUF4375 domain-containing protein [Flavipsychrobacter sp.]